MRLAKYLAGAGVASRRKAEQIIRDGQVRVNGVTVTLPQYDVTASDMVMLDGTKVEPVERKYYLLLNKPAGYLSTAKDTHGRDTVLDLVKEIPARVYPVGRLDADTGGVLLLTNDGALSNRLTHPRYQIEKTYRAWVSGVPSQKSLEFLSRGVDLEGRTTAPAAVRMVKAIPGRRALLQITLTEGRKRQVKKMCDAVGHPVTRLKRVRFAFLTAAGLSAGQFRHLESEEIRRLYKLTGLTATANVD